MNRLLALAFGVFLALAPMTAHADNPYDPYPTDRPTSEPTPLPETPSEPDPVVSVHEYMSGWDCEAKTVTLTTDTSTIGWVLEGYEWVTLPPVDTTETRTEPAPEGHAEEFCKPVEPAPTEPTPPQPEPTCQPYQVDPDDNDCTPVGEPEPRQDIGTPVSQTYDEIPNLGGSDWLFAILGVSLVVAGVGALMTVRSRR